MNGPLSLVVKAAVALLIVWVIVHDIAAVLLTHYAADDIAQAVANASAMTWRTSGKDKEVTVETARQVAEQKGAKLIGFSAEPGELLVKIKTDKRETIVARFVSAIDDFSNGEAIASAAVE